MASPPPSFSPAGSPPHPTHMQLARKRSTSHFPDALPSLKRRKASILSVSSIATPMTGHPLRQASFPPPEGDLAAYSRSPSVDSTAPSTAVGSTVGIGGKEKGKKRGRKPKSAAGSGAAGASTRAHTPSVVDGGSQAPSQRPGGGDGSIAQGSQNATGEEQEDDDDPEANVGAEMTVARSSEKEAHNERQARNMLVKALEPEQMMRYERWRSSKLGDAPVKKLVNATVSQSVPNNVVLSVQAATKLFLGELVEMARDVQTQWIGANGESQCVLEEPTPPESITPLKGGRRAPLRPDHMAEAYRRYKKDRHGGGVGINGAWHQQNHSGVERFAPRAAGKRLFR
ncbi:Transcription initiation factor TFIID subunit 11 [Zalerion maritima]|uniref:Transcription initiation factor TFIID subunit 11 n=1 Tax=Zalerion maritima TaxID=339359 RepID=A0AAD5RJK8_9PEZI|nr:Transcription initiation factor TFIID subunit 11 [Zalerion maritima]